MQGLIPKLELARSSGWKSQELWELLGEIAEHQWFGRLYCVLDGLDECDERVRVSIGQNLKDISDRCNEATRSRLSFNGTRSVVKFFFTSRPWQSIQLELSPFNPNEVDAKYKRGIDKDIKRVARVKVGEIAKLRKYDAHDSSLRAIVEETLVEKAEGMFLYLTLAYKILLTTSPRDVRKKLEKLPAGLSPLYDELLGQLDCNSMEYVRRIISSIVDAARPLSLVELYYSCLEEPLAETVSNEDLKNIEDDMKAQLALCGPIIEIRSGSVVFCHQSIRDYFTENGGKVAQKFYISTKIANFELAKACLAYVTSLYSPTTDGLEAKEGLSELCEAYPFLGYSAQYCLLHTNEAEDGITEDYIEDFEYFINSKCQQLKIFLKLWGFLSLGRALAADDFTASHFAVYLDKSPLMARLISNSSDLQSVDGDGKNIIHWAASEGSSSLIAVLLKRGDIDCEVTDRNGMTALHHAAAKGHLKIMEQVLQANQFIDVNAKDGQGQTPLHLAAQSGCMKSVTLLLKAGADLLSQDDKGRTALHFTCIRDKKEYADVATALLKKGAAVNCQDHLGDTPLHWAAQYGASRTAKILLNFGRADMELQNFAGATPLNVAAFRSVEVAKLLITRNANLEAVDGLNRTPLLNAARAQFWDLTRLLIDVHGVNVKCRSKDGDTVLSVAASWEVVEESLIKSLVEKGVDLDARHTLTGLNALHMAARGGNVRLLLPFWKDISAKCKKGRTALHYAAYNGHKRDVELLMKEGLDPGERDMEGKNALHLALEGDASVDTIEVLLQSNLIDVNAMDNNGCAALHMVLFKGQKVRGSNWELEDEETHTTEEDNNIDLDKEVDGADSNEEEEKEKEKEKEEEEDVEEEDEDFLDLANEGLWSVQANNPLEIVKILYLFQADLNAKTENEHGYAPLHWACVSGNKSIIEFLLNNGAQVNATSARGHTALHIAVLQNNLPVIRLLVGKGANVNANTLNGLTPMQCLIKAHRECAHALKVLLDNGASVDVKDENVQRSIVHWAVDAESPDAVRVLLEHGCSPNIQDRYGCTALHSAVASNLVEIVRLLLDHGADPRLQNKTGWTPLHFTVSHDHRVKIVELLLEWDLSLADIKARNTGKQETWLPLHYAAVYGNLNTVKTMIQKGVPAGQLGDRSLTALHCAAKAGNAELVRYLIEQNVPVNIQITKSGSSPLHFAAQFGHLECCQLLLSAGAEVDALSITNATPLHRCCKQGNVALARLLYEHGADIEKRTKAGKSPFTIACKMGHLKIAEFLIEVGANMFAKDENGWTALHEAAGSGNIAVAEFLVSRGLDCEALDTQGRTFIEIGLAEGFRDFERFRKAENRTII